MLDIARWRVKTKLLVLVLIPVLGFGAACYTLYRALDTVGVESPSYHRVADGRGLLADVLPPAECLVEAYQVALQMLQTQDAVQMGELIQTSRRLRDEFEARSKYWDDRLGEETESQKRLKDALTGRSYRSGVAFLDLRDRVFLPTVRSGDIPKAQALAAGDLQKAYADHRAAVDEVISLARTTIKQEEDAAAELLAKQKLRAGIWLLVSVLLGLVVGTWVISSIGARLNETVNILSSTATQMAATVDEQENMAMNQSTAVNETATTMEELNASFGQTAEIVEASAVATQQSMEEMSRLKEKVGAIAEQILSLSEQTTQIGSITNLVSDLANQTNMLALNAAVEAARAGEHGKGFAVVSTEIRKLADESKKSAERINAIVEDIQRATNSTVMATEESSKALEGVSAALASASDSAHQTLFNVKQQVNAVQQVAEAVATLSTGAMEAVDGLGQTKDGVENMRTTALKLKALV